MNDYTIELKPSCFISPCRMTISVPAEADPEEYIDGFLDAILNDDIRYNAEWEFV